MKLNYKFTLWYLSITFFVMLIGGAIVYYEVKHEIDNAEVGRLKRINDNLAAKLKDKGVNDVEINKRAEIIEFEEPLPLQKSKVVYHSRWNTQLQCKECKMVVSSFYTIAGKNYSISTYDYVVKSSEILAGVLGSFKWILVLLLLFVWVSGLLISKRILAPFEETLRVIQSFNLKQKKQVELPHTRTAEFKELNSFLKKMTDKALEDYLMLKEFTENASHELQTPLAVIRSKLELLIETDISDNQASHINAINNSVNKLSNIHKSLILLTKLENHEYTAGQAIDFSQIVNDAISNFKELIEMKNIRHEIAITPNVHLHFNTILADILVTNLISNSIRHNQPENGTIQIILTEKHLLIRNSGVTPEGTPDQMFLRFKKSNQSNNSIGLGLSIVKQICDINGFTIKYTYENSLHQIYVSFKPETNTTSEAHLLYDIKTLPQTAYNQSENIDMQKVATN